MRGEQRRDDMENRKEIEAQRIKRQLKQTAAERYADQKNDIAVLMDCIQMELDEHAKRAAEKPTDWGFVGDMGRIRESMREILQSLLIGRHGWNETEAARFVTDHLETMREDRKR
jgi:hypothetical protein